MGVRFGGEGGASAGIPEDTHAAPRAEAWGL
jgi:hypothetical protein